MPRIPDVTDLGSRPVPRSRRGIVSDRSAEIIGGGLQNASDSLASILDRRDQFNHAAARTALLKADIDTRSELENDPDFGTKTKRYREKMLTAVEQASKGIRQKSKRALFEQDAKLDVERGAEVMSRLAFQQEGDWGRATLKSGLETNRTSALNAKDERTRTANIESARALIFTANANGYIDRELAGEEWRRFQATYAEGYVALLDPEKRVEVLNNPKGTPADLLAPDQRALLLRAAQNENREVRVRRESQAAEDRIYAEGGSLESMRAQARRIEDPEVRDSTVARVEARVADREADRERHDAALRRQAWDVVLGGGQWEDIPTSVTTTMNPQDGIAIKNYLRVGGGKTATDAETWYLLKQVQGDDPAAFASLDLLKFRDRLGEEDFEQLAEAQVKIGEDVRVGYSVQTDNQMVNAALNQMGINTTAKAGKTNVKRAAAFRLAFERAVNAEQHQQGRKLSADEKHAIIDKLSMEVVTERGLIFDSTERAFEAEQVLEIVVPRGERKKIIAALEKAGEAPTDERIRSLYARANDIPPVAAAPAETSTPTLFDRALGAYVAVAPHLGMVERIQSLGTGGVPVPALLRAASVAANKIGLVSDEIEASGVLNRPGDAIVEGVSEAVRAVGESKDESKRISRLFDLARKLQAVLKEGGAVDPALRKATYEFTTEELTRAGLTDTQLRILRGK